MANTLDTRRKEIYRWLNTTNPFSNHEKAMKEKTDSTGLRFIHGNEFAAWKAGEDKSLWLHGRGMWPRIVALTERY